MNRSGDRQLVGPLGPTGVGKTETTIAFTSYILGAEALERFDMSEYQMQGRLDGLVCFCRSWMQRG